MSEPPERVKFILTRPYQFAKWKMIVENTCAIDDNLEILDGSFNLPARATEEQKKDLAKRKRRVLNLILLNLSDEYASRVDEVDEPHELFKSIEKIVVGEKDSNLLVLQSKMRSLVYSGSVIKLVAEFRKINSEYKSLGGKRSDHELCQIILDKLPDNFDDFVL